jgi:energy-coupling factor transporter ATP-binding protein EcfA2
MSSETEPGDQEQEDRGAIAEAGPGPAGEGEAQPTPAPRPAAPAPAAPGVRFNDRVLVLGYTGSGKSELLNHQFSAIRCQRVLLDSKDEWKIAGVEPVRGEPAAIDWRAPIIHYVVGEAGNEDEIDELFRACFARRHLVVAAHELEDLCNYNAHRTPRHLRSYISQGRTHGLGLLGAAQRPLEIPKRARTEADHHFVTVKRPDDMQEVARMFGVELRELDRELETARQHGEFAFLWHDKRAGEISICPELPDRIRAASIVQRVSVA